MSMANVYQFQDTLSKKLWNLDTRAHAAVFMPEEEEEEYLSVNDFLYARCGVVANGREYYEQVIKTPAALYLTTTL